MLGLSEICRDRIEAGTAVKRNGCRDKWNGVTSPRAFNYKVKQVSNNYVYGLPENRKTPQTTAKRRRPDEKC